MLIVCYLFHGHIQVLLRAYTDLGVESLPFLTFVLGEQEVVPDSRGCDAYARIDGDILNDHEDSDIILQYLRFQYNENTDVLLPGEGASGT